MLVYNVMHFKGFESYDSYGIPRLLGHLLTPCKLLDIIQLSHILGRLFLNQVTKKPHPAPGWNFHNSELGTKKRSLKVLCHEQRPKFTKQSELFKRNLITNTLLYIDLKFGSRFPFRQSQASLITTVAWKTSAPLDYTLQWVDSQQPLPPENLEWLIFWVCSYKVASMHPVHITPVPKMSYWRVKESPASTLDTTKRKTLMPRLLVG